MRPFGSMVGDEIKNQTQQSLASQSLGEEGEDELDSQRGASVLEILQTIVDTVEGQQFN